MERIKEYLSSVDRFKSAINHQGLHKVFDDLKTDLSLMENSNRSGLADKLCQLQNDHTWIMQALANILLMCKGDKTSYHPAILLGCYDKNLEKMNEAVYHAVLYMQKLIKELEEENKKLKDYAARV